MSSSSSTLIKIESRDTIGFDLCKSNILSRRIFRELQVSKADITCELSEFVPLFLAVVSRVNHSSHIVPCVSTNSNRRGGTLTVMQ